MATPSFNALIEEVTGQLAGSRFQDSTFGQQFRPRISPQIWISNFLQLSRGEFGYLVGLWKDLTTVELASFITAAGTLPGARLLFLASNINLSLIDEATISTYLAFTAPAAMPLQINELTPATFIVQASSPVVIVPADTKLLLYATTDKLTGKIFTDPKEYFPMFSLDEGEDLSAPIDIINDWQVAYGRMHLARSVCIKSVLIDKRNGIRGPEAITCSNTAPPITGNTIIDDTTTQLVSNDGTFITFP